MGNGSPEGTAGFNRMPRHFDLELSGAYYHPNMITQRELTVPALGTCAFESALQAEARSFMTERFVRKIHHMGGDGARLTRTRQPNWR